MENIMTRVKDFLEKYPEIIEESKTTTQKVVIESIVFSDIDETEKNLKQLENAIIALRRSKQAIEASEMIEIILNYEIDRAAKLKTNTMLLSQIEKMVKDNEEKNQRLIENNTILLGMLNKQKEACGETVMWKNIDQIPLNFVYSKNYSEDI